MSKKDAIEVTGVVREALPNAIFKVELEMGMRYKHIFQVNLE